MSVKEAISKYSGNLSFIKFLAALLVIVCHAFPITNGPLIVDYLARYTNGALGLGSLAVGIFFFSSGLYVSRSYERKRDFKSYIIARIKRIFPPLIIVVLVTVFIFGPFISSLNIMEYFGSKETYLYLLNSILIPIHNLPGVFINNIYGQTVNGSLWTLPVEFICYIGVFILYKLTNVFKYTLKIVIFFLGILFVLVNFFNIGSLNILASYLSPAFMFFIGILFYNYRNKIILTKKGAYIAFTFFIATIIIKIPQIGLLIGFPYFLLYISTCIRQVPKKLSYLGNYSYWIYLLAFPIQQLLVQINNGRMEISYNAIGAMILSIAIAVFFYELIEKKIINKYI